jgi:AcrR family transcriptional regulator
MAPRPPQDRKSPESLEKKPGRGRPPTIDSEQLLAVAREVFLERGIRATTLEVAQRAGISEGAVFHRFKSKEGLFSAAMNFDRENAPQLLIRAVREIEGLELKDALVVLASKLVEVGRIALPIMMMSWSNPQLCGATPFDKKKAHFRAFLKELGAYFERNMDANKVRRMDAEVLARAFVGAVHHYCMTRMMLDETDDAVIPEGMFVRGLVDLFLNGAAPQDESASLANRRFPTPKSQAT